jgi:pimeloyl-ACP methyl ester carboxylesterase
VSARSAVVGVPGRGRQFVKDGVFQQTAKMGMLFMERGGVKALVMLVFLTVAGLGTGCAHALDAAPLPGTTEYRIDEPVFNGQAYVYEAGKGNPRSIVLIHGLGEAGAHDYDDAIPWLAKDFHVVTFDLPGFARSSKANLVYSPTNYATFVKFVVDKYVRRPFVLLGHSMGGVVALRYAATYPGDVERLVVADTPGVLYRLSFTSQFVGHLGKDFLPAVINPQQTLAGFVQRLLGRVERTSFDPEVILASPRMREGLLGSDPGRIAGLALVVEDLSKAIPAIAVPTLVIWGKDDTTAPLRTGKLLATMIPNARLMVLAKTGHAPMTDNPAVFREAVEPFLRGDPIPPAPPAVPPVKHGDVRCVDKRNQVFEGDYDTLVINDCPGARIRNARIGQLRVIDAAVEIEDSVIGGGDIGLHAHDSSILMTSGRIEGETAIYALKSRIDLAGVTVSGKQAAMVAGSDSWVVFSIGRIESPNRNGPVQGYFRVVPGKPL